MEIHNGKKTSMGRQKIEIKKIEKTSQLQVTFSKRRSGIFNKAGELSVLCGANVAVLVTSPARKVFAFGNPSVDAVIDRFLAGNKSSGGSETESGDDIHCVQRLNETYAKQLVKELEAEKHREKAVEAARGDGEGGFWWNEDVNDLGLHELEQYKAALEVLKCKVIKRADEMATARALPENFLVSGGAIPVDPYLSCSIEYNCFNFDYN